MALDKSRLTTLFDYNPETGAVIRRSNRKVVGSDCTNGYKNVYVDGKKYYVHRLIWVLIYGELDQSKDIDHINGIRDDNRLENLRIATRSENMQNERKARLSNLSTGELGISKLNNSSKYRAKIRINGKQKHIGYFETLEDAKAAYVMAKREFHPRGTI